MKDTIQWTLIGILALFAVSVGADLVGIDLHAASRAMLSFLQTFGLLLLIFTGSAAAIEVAKYFRKKNLAQEEGKPTTTPSALSERQLELMLKRAMAETLSPLREDVGKVQARLEQERNEESAPRLVDGKSHQDVRKV